MHPTVIRFVADKELHGGVDWLTLSRDEQKRVILEWVMANINFDPSSAEGIIRISKNDHFQRARPADILEDPKHAGISINRARTYAALLKAVGIPDNEISVLWD